MISSKALKQMERDQRKKDAVRLVKYCSVCKQSKPISEFYKATHSWDGFGWVCQECSKDRVKKNAAKYKDRKKEVQRLWYLKNREAILARQRKRYANKYSETHSERNI